MLVEVRLNDGKRGQMNAGDIIEFTKMPGDIVI